MAVTRSSNSYALPSWSRWRRIWFKGMGFTILQDRYLELVDNGVSGLLALESNSL